MGRPLADAELGPAVPPLAAPDRRERDAEPPAGGGPARVPRGPCGGKSVSGGAAPSPETEVLAAVERDELVRAIAALREEDRLVIACRHFLELGQDETAAVLGVPAGTVKSRHSRALERLRAQLEGTR